MSEYCPMCLGFEAEIRRLREQLAAAEREAAAWAALVNWAHRGAYRGLDAIDGEVLVISSDRVVFVGKSAIECVENMPALAGVLEAAGPVKP